MKCTLGTYTKRSSQGIYQLDLSETQNELTLIAHVDNPTYLTTHKDTIFTVIKEQDQGGLAVVINGEVVAKHTEVGAPPCYVHYDVDRSLIYTSNYHGGFVNVYTYQPELGLNLLEKIQYNQGSKAHFVAPNPNTKEIVVCDLGLDQIHTYTVGSDHKLNLKHTFDAELKQGPRHIAFHPTLPVLYAFMELSAQLLVLVDKGDHYQLIQTLSTLPLGQDAIRSGAAIRISSDGRFVYTSNRGHDSISVFQLDQSGQATMIQNISSQGKHPRDFNLSLDEKYLLVANMETDNLALFARNSENGQLTLIRSDIEAYEVVNIEFNE